MVCHTDEGLEELARGLPNLRNGLEAMEDKAPPAISAAGWLNAGPEGLDLKQLESKVVLVDFWGSWCHNR